MIKIPAVQYIRPHGERSEGGFEIEHPQEASLISRLAEMVEAGIEITVEATIVGINVCFDDGQSDYGFWLFPNDEELPLRVAEKVLAFDKEDYARYRLEAELQ